jgi:hypothetical protein
MPSGQKRSGEALALKSEISDYRQLLTWLATESKRFFCGANSFVRIKNMLIISIYYEVFFLKKNP